jgi:hypothetical protein
MKANQTTFLTLAASLMLMPIVAAVGDTPVMKTDSLADIFNATAQGNHLDKTAKLERCKAGLISTWCQYRISERTIMVASGRKSDALVRNVTIITSRQKGEPVRVESVEPLFTEEAAPVWPVVIQILNPELSPEQRSGIPTKFDAAIKNGQASFTTKAGVNRYSAAAAPDMGIWMVANVRSPGSTDTAWFANWRKRVEGWIKR